MNPTPTDIPTPICDAHSKALADWYDELGAGPNMDEISLEMFKKHPGTWCAKAEELERENTALREEKVEAIRDRSSALMHIKKLTQQCDELKAEIEELKQGLAVAVILEKSEQALTEYNSLLEKTICELREALKEVESSWAIWLGTPLSTEFLEKIRKALSLTPSEISEKWVKREVLEKLSDAIFAYSRNWHQTERQKETAWYAVEEALTLARTELGNKNSG